VLAGHSGRLNAVRLGPSGTIALTVSDDYTARVWDLPSRRCMHVLKGAQLACRPQPPACKLLQATHFEIMMH
jgi:WD40 repeat protein